MVLLLEAKLLRRVFRKRRAHRHLFYKPLSFIPRIGRNDRVSARNRRYFSVGIYGNDVRQRGFPNDSRLLFLAAFLKGRRYGFALSDLQRQLAFAQR